ncbi:MAG: flagellar M-ring protein FliF [Lachnospiraceae bacterium]|nr:flagellar M-ring protein FliF [Ruminococcus sp.]MCM1273832.1 flagellar M-ring protein FliF [Lachnospiraceae bacterium]
MNERVKKVTTFVKDKWTGFSKAVKIMVVAIPVAVVAIIIILAILLSHKDDAVLFSGLTTAEQTEIAAAISDLGVTDVRIRSNGDVIVPDDQVDYLRMQLAVQGYPKSSSNYDIWNDGVDLWSTDKDKQEVKRQQRETQIAAALTNLSAVRQANVILDVPETKDYVITATSEVPTCSVQLELVNDGRLTNAEVRAIFNLVTSSVYGLTRDNVSITDTYQNYYDWVSEEEEAAGFTDPSGVTVGRRRLQFQHDMEAAIKQNIDSMMTTVFGKNGYALNVSASLNFDDVKKKDTYYYPSGDNNTGVLDHDQYHKEVITAAEAGGLVGVTPNGDQSPEYPTLDDLDEGEGYYYETDEHQYDVSNLITEITGDGYKIDKLSVGVIINSSDMSQLEREMVEDVVANAVGAEIDNVSVWNTVFAITGTGNGTTIGAGDSSGIFTRPVDPYRNVLLFVVIALGIILIALLILSLCMSRSRKKKIRRRQEQALAAAQAAAAADVYSGGGDREMPQEMDFNIASLTQEAGKESRETILKREIADFAKTSPEIVASIIKNMLREEG